MPSSPKHDPYFGSGPGIKHVKQFVQELSGILGGVAADDDINEAELIKIHEWLKDHEYLLDRHPFSDVEEVIQRVLADGLISSEEHAELLWMCERLSVPNAVLDALTDEICKLHGYLEGIAADSVINPAEVERLRVWCKTHEQFQSVWPFDVTMDLLNRVLDDGRIDPHEHRELIKFCADFGEPIKVAKSSSRLHGGSHHIQEVLTKDSQITFKNMRYCFAGRCSEGDREEMHIKVVNRGGETTTSVGRHLNYLVIGDKANPVWSMSAYGHRVDQALKLRAAGVSLSIIPETAFMSAVRATKPANP